MISYKPKRFRHPDLTRTDGKSVGKLIEPLLISIDSYKNLIDLKGAFLQIIKDSNTIISPHKLAEYKNNLINIYTLGSMQKFITNIYFKAANKGLK